MTTPASATQKERFRRVAWPWMPHVLRFARFLTGSESEADDLAQDTMLRALENIDRFEEGTNAKAWLLTIERRLYIDRYRTKAKHPTASLDSPEAIDPVAPEPAVHDEAWEKPDDLLNRFGDQHMLDALQTLPDDIRWTLLLVDVEGMDHAEAGELLGVPVGTIKSRTHRGRAMLRDRLYERALELGWVEERQRKSA